MTRSASRLRRDGPVPVGPRSGALEGSIFEGGAGAAGASRRASVHQRETGDARGRGGVPRFVTRLGRGLDADRKPGERLFIVKGINAWRARH